MPPLIRFPANPLTPHGGYYFTSPRTPQMWLTSYDETVQFCLMGGQSIADRINSPGRVEITSLKGLIGPWRTLDQKGATQDGVTFVDSMRDPIEVEMGVRIRGSSPQDCRRVARYLFDSLDDKQTSRNAWFTQDMGYWWADLRWFKTPADPVGGIKNSTHELTLVLRADSGLWKTHPSVDAFSFVYRDVVDKFDVPHSAGLGPNWPVRYTPGDGYVYVAGGEARWHDDPDTPFLTQGQEVVCGPYRGFHTSTDNQVVSETLGSLQEWTFPDRAENHLWARMGRNPDGSWDGSGVRLEFDMTSAELSYFYDYVKTGVIGRWFFGFPPPITKEKFTLVAGFPDNPRRFTVMRNKATLFSVVERGTQSPLGPDNRGLGWGSRAGGALITQATPAAVREFAGGDNATITQEGFVQLSNPGDQRMFPTIIVTGPGTFRMWDGPGAADGEYVQFGPLLEGQVMFLRTDPRKRGVRDLTSLPPNLQQSEQYEAGLRSYVDFAAANNVSALENQATSVFGVRSPQGNPYSLLKGRWSRSIPPKSPGKPAEPHSIRVSIVDGNANSKMVYAGVPLRRMPY